MRFSDENLFQLLTATIQLASIRKRRLRARLFAEPKRTKLLGLYDQLELKHVEAVDILLSMSQN